MADEMIIRECHKDEGRAVLDLWQQSGDVVVSPTDTRDVVQAAINHSAALFLVAESESRTIGTLIGAWDEWRGEFYRLAISPEVRLRGVARILVHGGEMDGRPRLPPNHRPCREGPSLGHRVLDSSGLRTA